MKLKIVILSVIFLCTICIKSFPQQNERIKASYMLAFGRNPYPSELNYWLGRGNLSIEQLILLHRQGFIEIPSLHSETIINSYIDALGRKPSEDEIKYWMNGDFIYIELLNDHMKLLQLNNWENERVIKLSYEKVFDRVPGNAEMNLWKKKGATAFFLLAGYLEYSKRTVNNEAGNIGAADVRNFLSVSTISLSPPIASEALKFINKSVTKSVAGIITRNGGNIITSGKHNIFPGENLN
ncbi:MAG: hypothetical protein M3004_00575 [Bacteroidota bacterium]|nr:hypothetical protein [Bacteroidota bacterium]